MHQSVRWFHIDGEHTGTAVPRELEFANQIVNAQGIVVIDDFFSPRRSANTTEVIPDMEKNLFHFRLLAVGFTRATSAVPGGPAALHHLGGVRHVGRSACYGAKTTIFKTTGPWDTDAGSASPSTCPDVGPIAGTDNEPATLAHDAHQACMGPARHLQNGPRMLKSAIGR